MLSSLRLAFRIARREALRYKGRSLLSIALLGIPLLGVSLGATYFDTTDLSDLETVQQELGETDAYITFDFEGIPVVQRTWTDQWAWTESVDQGEYTELEYREVPESAILATLPDGSSIAPYNHEGFGSSIRVETPDGVGTIDAAGYDLSDPLYEQVNLEYLEGGKPQGDEIVLSEAAAEYLETGVGETIALADGSAEYTVAGIVELPWKLNGRFAIGTAFQLGEAGWIVDSPGEFTHDDALALNELGMSVWARTLVENPPTVDPAYSESRLDSSTVMVFGLIVTVIVVEIVLLAGPAFMISARRRQREFAVMSAAGAAPKHLRNTVLAGGALFGLIAAVVSLTIGILLVWASLPLIEEFIGRRVPGLRVMPVMQAMLAGLAIAIGLLAALAAAISASRVNVVAALAGRTPQRRVRKRWPIIGLMLVGFGVAAGFLGIAMWSLPLMSAAIVAIQFGLIACTPMLVTLIAKLGRWLPLAPRMALREAGRNRGSTAPAIAAVMGVVAAGVAISLTVAADNVRSEQWQVRELTQGSISVSLNAEGEFNETGDDAERPDFEAAFTQVEPILQKHLDDLESHPIDMYGFGGPCGAEVEGEPEAFCYLEVARPEKHECVYWSMDQGTEEAAAAAVEAAREDPHCDEDISTMGAFTDYNPVSADPPVVAAYTGFSGAELDAAVELLESGGILVSDRWAITDEGTAVLEKTVESWDGESEEQNEVASIEFPAMAVDHGLLGYNGILLGPGAAEELEMAPDQWARQYLLTSSTEVTSAVQEAIDAEFEQRPVAGMWVNFRVYDYEDRLTFIFMLVVAALCGVIALGATAVSTGLIVAESKQDMMTLGAVGAEPTVRKRFAMWQTAVIAWLGAGLGTVAGLIGYVLIREALNRDLKQGYPFETLYGWELPWVNFGISLLAVPLIAALGAIVFTRAKLPSERRLT